MGRVISGQPATAYLGEKKGDADSRIYLSLVDRRVDSEKSPIYSLGAVCLQ